MAFIIVDPGSTHMGKLDYALQHITHAAYAGASLIKFQLFKNPPNYAGGNIELPIEWWPKLKERADECKIELTASVFDEDMLDFLIAQKPKYIKFSYSKKGEVAWIEKALNAGIIPIVSCDVMTDHLVPDGCIKLYCIPEYPVRYRVSFDDLFPRFDGFSSHTMGIEQDLRAIKESGAQYLEKHSKLDGQTGKDCPDASFAVDYSDIARISHFSKWALAFDPLSTT